MEEEMIKILIKKWDKYVDEVFKSSRTLIAEDGGAMYVQSKMNILDFMRFLGSEQ